MSDVRPDRIAEARQSIEALVNERTSGALLEAYYDPEGPFAGSTFESLGEIEPNRINEDDLLAITLLDVTVPPDTLRRMLGSESQALSDRLESIGSDCDLWQATDENLAAAEGLWDELRGFRGIDWVIAGKLLARKRPKLIPVVDQWTERAVPAAKGQVWDTLRHALDGTDLPGRLEDLRPSNATPSTSTLRLLDALIWMRNSESGNARTVREACGIALTSR